MCAGRDLRAQVPALTSQRRALVPGTPPPGRRTPAALLLFSHNVTRASCSWTRSDLNGQPSPCKSAALPLRHGPKFRSGPAAVQPPGQNLPAVTPQAMGARLSCHAPRQDRTLWWVSEVCRAVIGFPGSHRRGESRCPRACGPWNRAQQQACTYLLAEPLPHRPADQFPGPGEGGWHLPNPKAVEAPDSEHPTKAYCLSSGEGRARTGDLVHAMHARYQLRHIPKPVNNGSRAPSAARPACRVSGTSETAPKGGLPA